MSFTKSIRSVIDHIVNTELMIVFLSFESNVRGENTSMRIMMCDNAFLMSRHTTLKIDRRLNQENGEDLLEYFDTKSLKYRKLRYFKDLVSKYSSKSSPFSWLSYGISNCFKIYKYTNIPVNLRRFPG